MANKLAHLVVEGNTYDIQDEELTNKFDGMTIELSLSNDYVITATLKDGNNTTLDTSTIDLPSENSIVSLEYDTTTNEIIGIYRDDTVAVPHRIRVALSNLQEKLTAGQNISITNNTVSLLGLGEASTETVTGIATLDNSGKVPSSQLPSYVDDVLEYDSIQDFPGTGETGKIYVALDTNLTYRWSGSVYVEISQSLALGETSSTAYRGDRGKTAYDHAAAKGSAYQSGLYKITTNSEGHVTSATSVQKSDITALGIPAQDTTYNSGVASEIDNNNNVNVKYDSDTLEVDSQNRLKVKSHAQTFNFNEAIENVNGTVNVRYKGGNWNIGRDSQTNQLTINGKFVKQVEDLDAYTDAPDGEIVEYIGETDENYTNGYFYKRHNGGSVQYETITITSGTPKLIYTNKYDNSIIEAYAFDTIESQSTIYANTSYSFYLQDSNYNNINIVDSTFNDSIIEYICWYEYGNYQNVEINSNADANNICGNLYNRLKEIPLYASFKTSSSNPSTLLVFDNIRLNVYWQAYLSYDEEDVRWMYKNILLSDIINNGIESIPEIQRNVWIPLNNGKFKFSFLQPYDDNEGTFIHPFVFKNDNNIFYLSSSSGSGYGGTTIYKLIDNNGNILYTFQQYLNCVTYNNPITASTYSTYGIALNVAPLYHKDYNVNEVYTSEQITITHRIVELDEYGNPITPIETPSYWQRIDVQPNTTSSLINDAGFITALVNNLTNYYTKTEVDNFLSQLETNIDWKEAVNTYADITTTYPNPQDGWTVNVKDTDYTYRYNGTEWVAISANAIPLATQSVNGLMSATDKTKLDGIEAGAEVNVQSDWNQSNTNADDYIKNKPVIPTITFRQWNTE